MSSQFLFRLRIRQVEQSCVFDLSTPEGQEISATLKYPEQLTDLYQNWQQIYRRRYELQSRARVGSKSGSGTPVSYDWDGELRIAETALLNEFSHWLGHAELLQIRETIQWAADLVLKQSVRGQPTATCQVNVLVECSPMLLARLPWETWRLAPKDTPAGTVRIVRTCAPPVEPPALANRVRRSKIRILAILAAAPDLNPGLDQSALRSLSPLAEIEFVHCQEAAAEVNHSARVRELKRRVADAIADERGWDLLFFAGHSDEAAMTGGKLELAAQATLSISEIEPQLRVAKQRGLQLAVFNSCCGLQIADSLIRLGLPQVVVMRERIQDAVAHKFLQQFCLSLSCSNDVHSAVLAACRYFASENISYPSAHLIPSLFRHPDPRATLFRIQPSSLQRVWQQWRPTRWEAIALGIISLLSLLAPVREVLSDVRYWSQAVYRQATQQVPPAAPPPVTLLQIDQASIDRKGIDAYKIKPMSRAYLAELVDRLRQLQVRVVGIDYLLDGATKEDPLLAAAVQSAIQQRTWFVFATRQNEAGQPIQTTPAIAKPNWRLQGDIDILGWDVMLPVTSDCRETCPFAYQLALAQILQTEQRSPQPQIRPVENLQHQVSRYLAQDDGSTKVSALLQQLNPTLGLQPVIDFSLPPNQVYQTLAAWDFLERPLADATLKALQQQVVIIASGGYDQADDNFPIPLAVQYWRSVKNQSTTDQQRVRSQVFPGATAHAYTLHHLLTQHRLLWIPDLWLIGIAVIVGKGVGQLLIARKLKQRQVLLVSASGATLAYGFICLQSYIFAAVILPWFLPSALVWLYILPILSRKA